MKQKLITIVSLLTLVFLGSWGTSFAATIILTNTTDTLDTFRTNYNTTVTNLNNALPGSTVTSITAGDGLLGGTITSSGTIYGQVGTSTLPVIGQLTYWSGLGTATSPAKLTSVATSTLSATSPLTGSFVQIGSGGSLGIQTASVSQAGALAAADFSKFNSATSTFTSPLVYTLGTNAVTIPASTNAVNGYLTSVDHALFSSATTTFTSPLTYTLGTNAVTLSTVPVANGGTGTTTSVVSQLFYGGSGSIHQSVATSSIGVSAGLTNSGTLGAQVGGSALTLKQVENRSFSYATSTAWTATTTIPLGVGYAEVWQNIRCYTDVGTLNVDFYYNSTHMTNTVDINASTTVGTFSSFTNTTPTTGSKLSVDIGTPASSPTKISCTVQNVN